MLYMRTTFHHFGGIILDDMKKVADIIRNMSDKELIEMFNDSIQYHQAKLERLNKISAVVKDLVQKEPEP